MRVAFCSVSATNDTQYWSGTPYFMARALSEIFPDFLSIAPLQLFSKPFNEKNTIYSVALKQKYVWELEPLLHRALSAEVARKLRACGNVDVIISPGCFPYPNIFLQTDIPIISWSDATISGLMEVHPGYRNICNENKWCGDKLQRLMLNSSSAAIFTSQWASDSAKCHYDLPEEKTLVIPFGANLHFTIEDELQLEKVLDARERNICRMVLVASDWQNKGGPLACDVLRALESAGQPAKLVVVGCTPPGDILGEFADRVEVYGPILKDASTSELRYTELLRSAHFVIHASAGDCFGITMCEANAWAVPVLARQTGGARSVVTDGENGYCFEPEASADSYASQLLRIFADYDGYLNLCRTSWYHFHTRLNWKTSCRQLAGVVKRLKQRSRV